MNEIVLMSHCLLNSSSKLKKQKNRPEEVRSGCQELLNFLMDEGIDIVQLPCPELYCYGINRWGHTKDQFDHPHYREECRKLFNPFLDQLEDYIKNSYKILGIIGVFGSPTCGVYHTYKGNWGGEISRNPELSKIARDLRRVEEAGIFMEEIEILLEERNLDLRFLEFNGRYIAELKEEILELRQENIKEYKII